MPRISINFHNIYLPHILTCKILTKNLQNQYSELCISEYDITEAIDPEEKYFSPKQTYFSLSHHLHEILKRNIHIQECVYSFTIYQNKETDNYEIMVKDIVIHASPTDTLEDIHERVNIIISHFPDINIPLYSHLDLRLLFTKYESFSYEDESINFENTFHFEQCIICNNQTPNVLFCNCGHLGICTECYKRYNKKQCVSCRMINTITRIL